MVKGESCGVHRFMVAEGGRFGDSCRRSRSSWMHAQPTIGQRTRLRLEPRLDRLQLELPAHQFRSAPSDDDRAEEILGETPPSAGSSRRGVRAGGAAVAASPGRRSTSTLPQAAGETETDRLERGLLEGPQPQQRGIASVSGSLRAARARDRCRCAGQGGRGWTRDAALRDRPRSHARPSPPTTVSPESLALKCGAPVDRGFPALAVDELDRRGIGLRSPGQAGCGGRRERR